MKSTYRSGLIAEYLAIMVLLFKGYRILAHRWKSVCGEIDIIARKKSHIIFVEVKKRPNEYCGLEAISLNQQRRIRNSANIYLSKMKKNTGFTARFDIILVLPSKIMHLQNYWGHMNS